MTLLKQDLDHCIRNAARSCMARYLGKYHLKDIQLHANKRTIQIEIVVREFRCWNFDSSITLSLNVLYECKCPYLKVPQVSFNVYYYSRVP